jgi:hypothetical protein
MNNTHTGLFNPDTHSAQDAQQQPGVFGLSPEAANQPHGSMLPHQQGDSNMMHPGSGAGDDFGRDELLGGLGDLHDHDPLHGSEGLGSHPLMLTTADSLLSQGSTDLCGLGDGFDVQGVQQQHGSSFGAAQAATRISIDMQDVLHPDAGLPGMHSGSPQLHGGSHSPGLSHFAGSGHTSGVMTHGGDSYNADSMKGAQQQNGTHYTGLIPQQTHHHQQQQAAAAQSQQQQRQTQQRQSQAQQRSTYAGSSRATSSPAAAAAAGGGDAPAQPVFRSQYRGVSYDKKKRKWRVQIKVAALGKSGE